MPLIILILWASSLGIHWATANFVEDSARVAWVASPPQQLSNHLECGSSSPWLELSKSTLIQGRELLRPTESFQKPPQQVSKAVPHNSHDGFIASPTEEDLQYFNDYKPSSVGFEQAPVVYDDWKFLNNFWAEAYPSDVSLWSPHPGVEIVETTLLPMRNLPPASMRKCIKPPEELQTKDLWNLMRGPIRVRNWATYEFARRIVESRQLDTTQGLNEYFTYAWTNMKKVGKQTVQDDPWRRAIGMSLSLDLHKHALECRGLWPLESARYSYQRRLIIHEIACRNAVRALKDLGIDYESKMLKLMSTLGSQVDISTTEYVYDLRQIQTGIAVCLYNLSLLYRLAKFNSKSCDNDLKTFVGDHYDKILRFWKDINLNTGRLNEQSPFPEFQQLLEATKTIIYGGNVHARASISIAQTHILWCLLGGKTSHIDLTCLGKVNGRVDTWNFLGDCAIIEYYKNNAGEYEQLKPSFATAEGILGEAQASQKRKTGQRNDPRPLKNIRTC